MVQVGVLCCAAPENNHTGVVSNLGGGGGELCIFLGRGMPLGL